MKCYIDAGNSRIKWQIGVKVKTHYQPWPQSQTEFFAWLALLSPAGGAQIERFIIASVVPADRQAQLAEALAQYFPTVPVQWLASRARCCGVQYGYTEIAQLGVDRFCALAAARQRFPQQSVIVINAGTAVTVDYLRADGVHEGGVIMPSLAAMAAGLNQLAPHLSTHWQLEPQMSVAGQGAGSGLATNTAGALQLGARWMLASALAQIIEALAHANSSATDVASAPVIIVSGGGAPDVLPLLHPVAVDAPDLVMAGIKLAARHAKPPKPRKSAENPKNAIKQLPSNKKSD